MGDKVNLSVVQGISMFEKRKFVGFMYQILYCYFLVSWSYDYKFYSKDISSLFV